MGPGRKICIVVPYGTKTTAVVEGLALFRVKLSFTTVSIAFSCFFRITAFSFVFLYKYTYSVLKQKLNSVMLNGDGNENGRSINII